MAARIYVGNLPPNVAERDLRDEFERFGQLRSIWVARKPPGFAFLEMEDDRDAEDAVKRLDGFQGWRVEFARRSDRAPGPGDRGPGGGDRGPRGGGGGGGGPMSGRELRCFECGEIGHIARDCRNPPRGTAPRRSSRSPPPRRSRSRSPGYVRRRSPSPRRDSPPPRRDSPPPRRDRSRSRSRD